MAKYKALIKFRGKKEDKVFEKDEEFEMTVKRSEEITKNITEKHEDIDEVMERLDGPEINDAKEEADKSKEEGDK